MSARAQDADWVSFQGNYAGSVSRFLVYLIDLAVSTGLFALGLAAASLAAQVVTGHSVSWNRSNVLVAILFAAWEFLDFGYSWAASGRTLGMAVLGVRVVGADGAPLPPRRGVVRALVFPLSFLFFGLGFLGILVQREHRALHDLIAGSAVIYSWDARAARLRFLAREADTRAVGRPPELAGAASSAGHDDHEQPAWRPASPGTGDTSRSARAGPVQVEQTAAVYPSAAGDAVLPGSRDR